MIPRNQRLRLLITALLTAVALPGRAQTPSPLGGPRVIPYDGVLELDGTSVNGDYALRFTIHEPSFTATEAQCDADADEGCLWSEERTVQIVNGRFSTLFGSSPENALRDAVFETESVFLSIAIQDPDGEIWHPLANHQRIVPTPYAYIAGSAPDFLVRENLSVGGDAVIQGSLAAGQATLAGPLTVAGTTQLQGDTTAGDVAAGSVAVDAGLTVAGPNGDAVLSLDNDADGAAPNVTVHFVGDNLELRDSAEVTFLRVEDDGTGPARVVVPGELEAGSIVGTLDTWESANYTTQTWHSLGRPVSNNFCALARVEVRDLDTTNDWAGCNISVSGDSWAVHATNWGSSDVNCEVICLSW